MEKERICRVLPGEREIRDERDSTIDYGTAHSYCTGSLKAAPRSFDRSLSRARLSTLSLRLSVLTVSPLQLH